MTGLRTSSRTLILLGGALALVTAVLAGLGFGGTPSAHAATISVAIRGYAFAPSSLTVHPGDTVTWTNYDDAPHTVTSSSGPEGISSPTLDKGQSFSFTFTKVGTDRYYCSVHPQMTGSVTVVASDTSPAATSPAAPGSSPSASPPSQTNPGGGGGSAPPSSSAPGGSGPSASPATGPSMGMSPPAPGSGSTCSNQIVVNAMLDPFVNHMYRAHLERSPGQQAGDALNLNQYVLTHTVLLEDMVAPAIAAVQASLNGIVPFTNHMYRAHLERSPGQQVNDALNVNQYVDTHTVLAEDMTAPAVDSLEGSYGC